VSTPKPKHRVRFVSEWLAILELSAFVLHFGVRIYSCKPGNFRIRTSSARTGPDRTFWSGNYGSGRRKSWSRLVQPTFLVFTSMKFIDVD
jgi:hypothetical protein